MKIKLLLSIYLIVSNMSVAQSEQLKKDYKPLPSEIELAKYYQQEDKNGERALLLAKDILENKQILNKASAYGNAVTFFARILNQRPELTNQWCNDLKSIQYAPIFKMANTQESKKCLSQFKLNDEQQKYVQAFANIQQLETLQMTPQTLDARWVSFFATGNKKYIEEIIDYIADNVDFKNNKPENVTKQDIHRLLTIGSAIWSLNSNIKQDENIKKIANDYVIKQEKIRQEKIKKEIKF